MCKTCDKEVIKMGILESDLQYLPFKLMHWFCMVDGCNCKTKVKDYGIMPLYYWPVKVKRLAHGAWRGGWFNSFHGYICSKHFKEYKADRRAFCEKYNRDEQRLLGLIKPIGLLKS